MWGSIAFLVVGVLACFWVFSNSKTKEKVMGTVGGISAILLILTYVAMIVFGFISAIVGVSQ